MLGDNKSLNNNKKIDALFLSTNKLMKTKHQKRYWGPEPPTKAPNTNGTEMACSYCACSVVGVQRLPLTKQAQQSRFMTKVA